MKKIIRGTKITYSVYTGVARKLGTSKAPRFRLRKERQSIAGSVESKIYENKYKIINKKVHRIKRDQRPAVNDRPFPATHPPAPLLLS